MDTETDEVEDLKEESNESDEQQSTDEDDVNYLEMSDEDFDNAGEPAQPEPEIEAKEEAPATEETPSDKKVIAEEGVEQESASKDSPDKEKDVPAEAVEINYKEQYDLLMAPFKANGKEMQVKGVDDVRSLMQMGANYNKKMAGLKPAIKIMKMLENNDLMSEEKLSYFIDLDKKNPEAIQKFIKESGIDPLDIDTEAENKYRPNSYTVDDKEVELDAVLDDIRSSPVFQDTVDIVSNKWDDPSKQIILQNPNILKVINTQVESGIYQQITDIVESERALGRLNGLSDIEAYKTVGDDLQERGAFVTQQRQQQTTEQPAPTPKPNSDPKLKDRKKAASSTRSSVGKTQSADFNPLSLSDEEFEKYADQQFI